MGKVKGWSQSRLSNKKDKTQHKFKGFIHFGPRDRCIICTHQSPGAIGNKTGGKW